MAISYKNVDMSDKPNAGQSLNDIRWDLHSHSGNVLDEKIDEARAHRISILDARIAIMDLDIRCVRQALRHQG